MAGPWCGLRKISVPKQIASDFAGATPHVLVDARFAPQQRGGDRCRYELARHLSQQQQMRYTFLGYRHAALALRQRNTASPPVVTTRYTPEQHPWFDLYEHVSLPLLARRIGADIYHGTFNVVPLLAPARATVVTIHDMAVFSFPQAYGRRFAAYMRSLIQGGIRRAVRIIAVSDATKQEIVRYFPDSEAKITTILNGVGQEFMDAAALDIKKAEETCQRLGIARPYVLFVGNLEPKKNLPRLIQAFQRLRLSTELPHTLVVVGKQLPSGPDGGVSLEEKQEGIHLTGYVDDVDLPALYRGADLIAYPSLYEGFGMPVLEGMAAGVPVLTSCVSSLPEVAGGAAMLVDPYDVDGIAAGLHRALADQGWRRSAVSAGCARASALSWDENARQTAVLYHQVWKEMQR